jgi:23S rRNA (pseudouridine1915-N3)-methyltransferase
MKIEFWAIGKTHEPYIAAGVDDFTRRIENYFPVEWRLFNPKKNADGPIQKMKQEECALIQAALKTDDWLVSLDEHGKSLNSRKLASFIQDRVN